MKTIRVRLALAVFVVGAFGLGNSWSKSPEQEESRTVVRWRKGS